MPPAPAIPPKSKSWTQIGIASWYKVGPDGHKTASGEPYQSIALTAAHRTLPFQSLVRVTNLKTNAQVVVRINDRGPFVNGRVIDLSLAAAKKLDILDSGVANVKLEVMHAPSKIDTGGKWGVQIGAFRQRQGALELKQNLAARYHRAHVSDFSGMTGYWLLVRVQNDDRLLAQTVASGIKVSEGGVYLVRLN